MRRTVLILLMREEACGPSSRLKPRPCVAQQAASRVEVSGPRAAALTFETRSRIVGPGAPENEHMRRNDVIEAYSEPIQVSLCSEMVEPEKAAQRLINEICETNRVAPLVTRWQCNLTHAAFPLLMFESIPI
ncbi:hypothetical protein NDU88_003261 [Pleurodeles waltl]|uniref:Uncharacterized protein n=1 Tax=Pleurodeles waltl TaxID=8319 RepID=A0AAV7TP10_PLEWA|nr:hypothetical protein NDU88_003261 [Pleurodeles waltl]